MPNPDEKRTLGLLRRAPLLSKLPASTIEDLVETARVESFRPRQVVYLPGDRSYGVHFLIEGRVKISKVTRDGKELTLAYRADGDFFGDACLLAGAPREEMAEAMDHSLTVEVDREQILAAFGGHADAAFGLALALIERQRHLETKMEQLIFKDVGAKLAQLLLRLGVDHGVENHQGVALGVKITHQEMANLIGSTRETVSLTLSQFKRKGFIATEGRKVILANQDGLRALA